MLPITLKVHIFFHLMHVTLTILSALTEPSTTTTATTTVTTDDLLFY
jgi:hypothetical protein